MNRIATILLAVGVVFAVCPVAQAAVIFQDDFTDTVNATLTELNNAVDVGSWTSASGNGHIESQELHLGRGWTSYALQTSSSGTLSDGVKISFDLTAPSPHEPGTRTISGYDADNGTEIFQLRFVHNTTTSPWNYADLGVWDGSSVTNVVTNVQWSDPYLPPRPFEIVLSSSSFDVWVDLDKDGVKDSGEYLNGSAYLNTPSSGFEELAFNNTNSGKAYYDIDNILIDDVPEPVSAVLLGLGGLGLVIRRRRRRS